jgi:hypothetical protein
MRRPSQWGTNTALREGFRSGLEDTVATHLESLGIPVHFEEFKVPYNVPARPAKYCPDFWLPNGIVIETKGRFVTADRAKHILIKAQHPELDIRFVFSRSKSTISKQSKTTYAMWCEKNGFMFDDKLIPLAWLNEKPTPQRMVALQKLLGEP